MGFVFRASAILATLLIVVSCTGNTGKFSLVNQTDEQIVHAMVTICGQTIDLKDIQPSQSASGAYKVTGESGYVVQVEFRSGKTLRKEAGYVTSGMNFEHEIVVTNSDIAISKTKLD